MDPRTIVSFLHKKRMHMLQIRSRDLQVQVLSLIWKSTYFRMVVSYHRNIILIEQLQKEY